MKKLLAILSLISTLYLIEGFLYAEPKPIHKVTVSKGLTFPTMLTGQQSDVFIAPQDRDAAVILIEGDPGLAINVTLPDQLQYVNYEQDQMTVKDFTLSMEPDGHLCELEGVAQIRIGARILNTEQNPSGLYMGNFFIDIEVDLD